MTIIEFCGTPGCGKTTICNQIEGVLLQQGYNVVNLHKKIYRYSNKFTFLNRIINKLLECIYKFYPLNKQLKKALQVLSPYRSNDSTDWINRILGYYYWVRIAEKKGVEIALFDEGCLQFITSIFHEKKVEFDSKDIVDALKSIVYRNRTIFIDCLIDINDNYQRLLSRNRKDNRFFNGDEKSIVKLLKQKRENIDIVLGILEPDNQIILNLSSDDNDIKSIIDKITEKL